MIDMIIQYDLQIIIINFTPANIKTTLKSVSDLFEKTIFSIYALQHPRRLENFAAMMITTETDPQKLKKLKKNKFLNEPFCQKKKNDFLNPSQSVYKK
jgi:hypothetical protein